MIYHNHRPSRSLLSFRPCAVTILGIFLFVSLAFPGYAASQSPNAHVVLQLAWKHQFQFAGYYAALHRGYYEAAGLDVTIIEGGEGRFAREEVLSGRAQYGVAGAELILHRAAGDPFVVMAPIFQHSPSVLLTRTDAGISNPQQLMGKRVMMLPGKKTRIYWPCCSMKIFHLITLSDWSRPITSMILSRVVPMP